MGAQHARKKKPITLAGYDGRYEEGRRDVPDPLEPGAKASVVVNIRATPLEHMASRGRLNPSQVAAGTRFTALCRAAAIGRQKSFDYSQPAVDGGKLGDPITDQLVHATEELNAAMAAAGMVGSAMLMAILAEEKGIAEIARTWSKDGGIVTGERAEGYVTGRFVEALDILVRHWRLEATGKPVERGEGVFFRNGREQRQPETIRAERGLAVTGPAYEAEADPYTGRVTSRPLQPDRRPPVLHEAGSPGRGGRGEMRRAA